MGGAFTRLNGNLKGILSKGNVKLMESMEGSSEIEQLLWQILDQNDKR